MARVAPKARKHLSADALFRLVHTGFDHIPDYRPADVDIAPEIPAGIPEQVVRTVTENSRTLKFTNHGFESE
jgi:hypothetical protein